MLKISIPTPCHQDWNAMTPDEQGRHCNACAKTVVDFTSMSDEAVKHFFINKKGESVCGRFHNQQLHRISIELPQNIFYIPMPVWKKFLVASLIVFSGTLFSCDTIIERNTTGKPEVSKDLTVTEFNIGKVPATLHHSQLPSTHGGIIMVYDSITTGISVPILPTTIEEIITGAIAIEDTVKVEDKVEVEIGQVLFSQSDSLKTKNPPKADSVNCNTQKFY